MGRCRQADASCEPQEARRFVADRRTQQLARRAPAPERRRFRRVSLGQGPALRRKSSSTHLVYSTCRDRKSFLEGETQTALVAVPIPFPFAFRAATDTSFPYATTGAIFCLSLSLSPCAGLIRSWLAGLKDTAETDRKDFEREVAHASVCPFAQDSHEPKDEGGRAREGRDGPEREVKIHAHAHAHSQPRGRDAKRGGG